MADALTWLEVLSLYGLTPESPAACQPIPSGSGNHVYAVSTTAGKVVLRQSHPTRTRNWLDLEAAVLEHLARADFPAVRQRPTLTGQPFVEYQGTFWTAFEYIDAVLAAEPDDAQLARIAHLQACLHGTLASFPAAERWSTWARQPHPRKTWAFIVPLADTLGFLDQLALEQRVAEALPKPLAEALLVAIHPCRRRLEQITRQLPDLPGMLTHYDYGQYNVLFAADGEATVIDFDLLCWESPAANLARAISVTARRQWMGPLEPSRAIVYLAAYESERLLRDSERAAVPALLRLFVLQYVIFHALLCVEESEAGPAGRCLQAMREDLQRDDELAAIVASWVE